MLHEIKPLVLMEFKTCYLQNGGISRTSRIWLARALPLWSNPDEMIRSVVSPTGFFLSEHRNEFFNRYRKELQSRHRKAFWSICDASFIRSPDGHVIMLQEIHICRLTIRGSQQIEYEFYWSILNSQLQVNRTLDLTYCRPATCALEWTTRTDVTDIPDTLGVLMYWVQRYEQSDKGQSCTSNINVLRSRTLVTSIAIQKTSIVPTKRGHLWNHC